MDIISVKVNRRSGCWDIVVQQTFSHHSAYLLRAGLGNETVAWACGIIMKVHVEIAVFRLLGAQTEEKELLTPCWLRLGGQ